MLITFMVYPNTDTKKLRTTTCMMVWSTCLSFLVCFFSLSLFIVFFFFFCKLRIISKVLSHCLYWFWCHLFNFEQPFLN